MSQSPASLTDHPRAKAMAQRLVVAAERAGITAAQALAVQRAFFAAIAARGAEVADPEHFAFLHPARNALIVMEDMHGRDPVLVTAALLFDGEHPSRMPPAHTWAQAVGAAAAELLRRTPLSAAYAADDAALLEALLACDEASRLLALVDRLDFVRHLHLDRVADQRSVHESTATVFLPVAERTHPLLARRFAWWLRTFARRLP